MFRAVASDVLVVLLGLAIIAGAVALWRSESFYAYLWKTRSRSFGGRFGPKSRGQLRFGARATLAGAIAMGLILVVVGTIDVWL
jgi:hypothetical protein